MTINGVTLWYKLAGAVHPGMAPLLYLPGGPGYNSYSFEKTIGQQLEQHFQVVYFDERGTGRSERPKSGDYAMSTLIADIDELRKSLGLPQISVMGQSFGGSIALEYAARYPQHVQRLILMDAGIDYPEAIHLWQTELQAREPKLWAKAMTTPEGRALAVAESHPEDTCARTKARFALVWQVYAMPGAADFHHWQQFHDQRYEREQDAWDAQSGLRNTGEMERAFFYPNSPALCWRFTNYSRLTMPVLVMTGKFDGAVDPHQAQVLATHLPHASYDEFEKSAHFPYAEEPAKFVADVSTFLMQETRQQHRSPLSPQKSQ